MFDLYQLICVLLFAIYIWLDLHFYELGTFEKNIWTVKVIINLKITNCQIFIGID